MKKAEEIGDYCHALIEKLLVEEPIYYLRSAQNIVRLVSKYSEKRINDACFKAFSYGNYSYKSIKNILEQNIENDLTLFEDAVKQKLSPAYARNLQTMMKEALSGN